MRTLTSLACLVLVAACGERPRTPEAAASSTPAQAEDGETRASGSDDWRSLVSAEDASRLGRLHQAWRLGRAETEERGFSDEVEALGPLVDPNAGLSGGLQPAPGEYRCRTFGLGAQDAADPAYRAAPWKPCRFELTQGGDLIFAGETLGGRLYADTPRRLVFLGAGHGTGRAHPTYGESAARNRIAVLERIGPSRWRLSSPWPGQGGKMELLEIVPA